MVNIFKKLKKKDETKKEQEFLIEVMNILPYLVRFNFKSHISKYPSYKYVGTNKIKLLVFEDIKTNIDIPDKESYMEKYHDLLDSAIDSILRCFILSSIEEDTDK